MDTNKVRIAAIGLSDIVDLAEVHVKAWRETYLGLLPQSFLDALSIDRRAETWRQIVSAPVPDSICLGVWVDDRLVGFMHAGPVGSPVLGSDLELKSIYLLQAVQGAGLGKKLMGEFIRFAQSRGKSRASLLVLKGNRTAGFYEKLGWRRGPEFELDFNGAKYMQNSYVLDL